MIDNSVFGPDFGTLLNGNGTLGVAVSGGGDSVALLYLLAEWGRRPLHVFHVNHGIHPDSGQWAHSVAVHADRLGLAFTGLAWTGDKPATGLSAAARTARHALLADAARAAGIRVLCLAHTADDIAEAAYMRDLGSNVGSPQTWSPSPAWPQGRGVFLCRPLLGHSRAGLRDFLRARNLTWIDDPANDNPLSLRARARQALAGQAPEPARQGKRVMRAEVEGLLHDPEGWAALGLLRFDAEAFRRLPREAALHLLVTAAVCAGGGDRLPRGPSVERLYGAMSDGQAHTLAGARIRQTRGIIHVFREAGDIGRHGPPRQEAVWDGRFEFDQTVVVTATGHDRSRLDEVGNAFLRTLPAQLRASLPMVTGAGPHLAVPLYGVSGQKHNETVTTTCWVLPRFRASACRVSCETDL
ncbi:tRNA lysidine(34) synthetase TilS [Asticcacaulis sp. AC402]|uniref:tRNA lysidine(34) synthetase TilS n=1 Tax=Asticcacaulis sp. AC402 TaxID=1282361 RepID=UPI0003C3E89C|nr:tRNA lysidine(34) synthetase TilS [Asticcacaulis sp. AC402]ESQ75548.1 hypothetical protein ABAC402_08460 [Asticcacaulis sp. AC402]